MTATFCKRLAQILPSRPALNGTPCVPRICCSLASDDGCQSSKLWGAVRIAAATLSSRLALTMLRSLRSFSAASPSTLLQASGKSSSQNCPNLAASFATASARLPPSQPLSSDNNPSFEDICLHCGPQCKTSSAVTAVRDWPAALKYVATATATSMATCSGGKHDS